MKRAVVGIGVTSLLVAFLGVVPGAADDATDVSETTHEVSIRAVMDAGVAQGYPDGTFRPSADVTRGQMAAFLQRALDLPDADPGELSDVVGTTHESAVHAVVAAGIAGGFPDGTFRPGDAVTRGQMARFLTNGLQLPADDTVRFFDVEGTTHAAAIRAVSGAGVAGGFGDGVYGPDATVTRGQMATFLARGLELVDRIEPPVLPASPPAVMGDGAAAWGWNFWGTLGDGNTGVVRQSTPVAVRGPWAGGARIADVAIGTDTTCVIADGDVYCWGYNQWGQVGDGTTMTRTQPTRISGIGALPRGGATAVTISIGGSLDGHTCVVADGDVFCWGINASGRLGDGTTTDRDRPVRVSGALAGRTVTAIAAGQDHMCALADGDVYCWGNNGSGQLGIRGDDGMSQESLGISTTPVALGNRGDLPDADITAIAATETTTCAVAVGQIYCWGQLVTGEQTGRVTAAPTALSPGDIPAGTPVDAIDGGTEHLCALAGGNAYCWGGNFWTGYQFGNGIETDQPSPVAVDTSGPLPAGRVTAISAGQTHSCAIAAGNVYCWGVNEQGELGDGSTADHRPRPVAVVRSGVLADRRAVDVHAGMRMTIISTVKN